MAENVTHPKHYNAGKFEVIEIINDQGLNFELGNAVKYICRAGRKDPARQCEDLQKAVWYIQWEIEKLTAAAEGRAPRRPNDMNSRPTSATDALSSAPPALQVDTALTAISAEYEPKMSDHMMSIDGTICMRCGHTRKKIFETVGRWRCQ